MTRKRADRTELLARCLGAFAAAGTLDLSLDHLARKAGTSKRMLIHYFRDRESIEEESMALLETRLRARFSPSSLPTKLSGRALVARLWDEMTAPAGRGVLLLVMDVSRRAWQGSKQARTFVQHQQELWIRLLEAHLPRDLAEDILGIFQGAILGYLVTGDRAKGRRAVLRPFRK